jgi:acyl transferase domain-containing protein
MSNLGASDDYLDGIAIVGMACRLPGAKNVAEFWQNLRDGVESITFFSDQELEAAGVDTGALNAPNYVRAKPILEDIEYFDAAFFKINPREAELLDPQQRLFLECAWEALEHAGYDPGGYRGRVGVYAGVDANNYLIFNIMSHPEVLALGTQVLTTNDKDYLSTRVSYRLNLRGPSVSVQTACSTSLVATHLACESLLNNECSMALAGGVTVNVPHKSGYFYREGDVVSPDGHCRAFDAQGQGTVFGSGVGIVVLKRLVDALADGDAIHAVIKGTAINNDGALKAGYTAPSVRGQMAVIAEALEVAEVDPETITYVEAHGTGTELGDPIEVAALTQAFRLKTERKGYCALGSVKTNVGHLAAAAGVVGLIKTVLALEHKQVPPSLHFEEPNPQIDFANSPFYVNTKLSEWRAESPRRAGVSSFGMGGTNAHVVVEEAPEGEPTGESRRHQLLVLSACGEAALDTMTDNLAAHLRAWPDLSLPDVAYTLQVGRQAFERRRMVVGGTLVEVAAALAERDPKRVCTGDGVKPGRPVVFMFSGQGSQYVSMGRDLYESEGVFREHVDMCVRILEPHLRLNLRRTLYPAEEEMAQAQEWLNQTELAQPALFVIEYALAQLWMSWGVTPTAMIGHSIGEYVAACLAGVFRLEDALGLVAERGRLMQSMPPGAMLSVMLPAKELQERLSGSLAVAAINHPGRSVVSGQTDEIEELERRLSEQEIACRRLHTSHAFHSEMMEPIMGPFEERVRQVTLQSPQVPYLSNVTGGWIRAEDATDPGYWAQHLRRTVRFGEGVSLLGERADQVLLEVGPGRALQKLAQGHPDRPSEQVALASMRHATDGDADDAVLLHALGQLWLTGVDVDWQAFYGDERRKRVPLPTYPFERQRYWLEAGDGRVKSLGVLTKRADITDWFYVPSWKRTMPLVLEEGNVAGGCWLVFGGESGLSERVCTRLAQRGYEVVKVLAGERFAGDDHTYTVHPARQDDYSALLQQIVQDGRVPTGIVHLWNVSQGNADSVDNSEKMLEQSFYSLLFLVQAISEQVSADLRLTVVSGNVQEVNGDEVIHPEKATLLGPCKVAQQENPQLACRVIDVVLPGAGSEQEEELVEFIIAELEADTSDKIVAYRGNKRWVQIYEPALLAEASDAVEHKLRVGGVYLITGGLGGVGLTLAEYLAEAFQARLVLTTRSHFPEPESWERWLATHDPQDRTGLRIQAVRALVGMGAEVLVVQADVTDQAQMEAAVRQACEHFGAIHGVIHAAGLPGGGVIPLKTKEAAGAVLAPKVQGVRVLEVTLRDMPLDFLVLCSSILAVIGGVGQVDYCAANAFMDAFALVNNGRGMVSINWDTWAGVGMAVNTPPDYIQPTEGVEAFRRILCWNRSPQIVVSVRHLPDLIEQMQASDVGHLPGARVEGGTRYARPSLQTPYVAPRNEVEETLASIWQEVLGLELVGIHDNFFELGGDSLIGLQVVFKAKRAGLGLTPRQLFQHLTIAELAAVESTGGILAEQGLVTGPIPLTNNQRWLAAGGSGGEIGLERLKEVEQISMTGEIPLTGSQEWFFEAVTAYKGGWNTVIGFALPLALLPSPLIMERMTKHIWLYHDQLRARFVRENAHWRQFIVEPDETMAPFYYIDLSELAAAEHEAAIKTVSDDILELTNLATGPLFRVNLFYLGQQLPMQLMVIVHHLIADGVSVLILMDDLMAAYGQVMGGEPIQLPPKTVSPEQWVMYLRNYAQSAEMRQEMNNYWLELPWEQILPLPVDYPENKGRCILDSRDSISVSLSVEETRALQKELPRRHNVQLLDALLLVTVQTATRWTGSRYQLISVIGTGRDALPNVDVDISRTICWTSSSRLLMLERVESSRPAEALQTILEQLQKIPNKGFGFDILHRYGDNDIEQKMKHLYPYEDEMIQVLYQGDIVDRRAFDTNLIQPLYRPGPLPFDTRGRDFHPPLFLRGQITDDRLVIHWEYNKGLFERTTVEEIAHGFVEELQSLIAQAGLAN